MKTAGAIRFFRDQRGGVAVEFVALLPAFLFLTFFVFDTVIAVVWIGTVEKAAQVGARMAVVSSLAVTGLPSKNPILGTALPGSNCRLVPPETAPDPCNGGFATRTCTAGSGTGSGPDCDDAGFTPIFNRMDAVANVLVRRNVTISYEYVGLGFANGPIVPRVTVTVGSVGGVGLAVPYNTFTSSILAALMTTATGANDFPGLTTMPPVVATFTGEDLSSLGAS